VTQGQAGALRFEPSRSRYGMSGWVCRLNFDALLMNSRFVILNEVKNPERA
jgi:hypothetical protein